MLLSALLLITNACKSPTTDIKVTVDMNILKYSALVHITDVNGIVPAGITLTLSGPAAGSIYEISGKKNFTVVGGIITLGLDPNVTPAVGADVQFSVVVTAPGYQTTTMPISFSNGKFQQVVNVALVLINVPPPTIPYTPPVPVVTSTHLVFDFNGYCANKPNINIRPSLYLFFRETGTNNGFALLGYMNQGHIETDYLALGKTYDFEITYNGQNYLVTQQIVNTNYTLTFNMGDVLCSSL